MTRLRFYLAVGVLSLGLFSSFRPFQIGSGFVLGLFVTAAVFPRSGATRLLFSQHGPSLDAEAMTRSECWKSARGFVVIALGAAATLYSLTLLEPWVGRDVFDVPILGMLFFMYALFFLMGIVGALYLALKAPFRPQARALPIDGPLDGG